MLPDWRTIRMDGVCTTDQLMFVEIPKLHAPTSKCVQNISQFLCKASLQTL